MTIEKELQKRINYLGDLTIVFKRICLEYNLGFYRSYEVMIIGYEDFNLVLQTDKGKYFIKIFASSRKFQMCKRYVEIMEKIIAVGINHPKLLNSSQGFLYNTEIDNYEINLCVIEYINGKSFFQLQQKPTIEEIEFIIEQAAKIQTIRLKPLPVYDSWAIPNFLKEYNEKKFALDSNDSKLIEPFVKSFSKLDIDNLPQCFIHGDIIATNVMRDTENKVYLIDFAVANYYPRIQELAVLLCDLFYYPDNPKKNSEIFNSTLVTYQKYVSLTDKEVKILPLYIQFAHVMHLLRANYEKVVNGNETEENEHYLYIGRKGLL